MLIAFAWVNATTRKDGSSLASTDIAQSIVSLVNADGSTTPVTTVTGAGTSATADAPTTPGTYKYQVQNVDTNGDIGDPVSDIADVVIPTPAPAAPAAPSDFTATLEANQATGSGTQSTVKS